MISRLPLRRALTLTVALGLAVAACGNGGGGGSDRPQATTATTPAPPPNPDRPNILFVMADDLDVEAVRVMPRLKKHVIDAGMRLDNFLISTALCCPSRASILRGQYAHNTGVWENRPPEGGFEEMRKQGHESSTVATWLREAGYRTGMFGKYLNGFPNTAPADYVPPGWDSFVTGIEGGENGDPYRNFNYRLSENGQERRYGAQPDDYLTDVLRRKTDRFIRNAVRDRKPFFAYVAPYTPHDPATPAPRHNKLFQNEKAPRTPAFNEDDTNDKPSFIRSRARLGGDRIKQIDALYVKRLQSLQAIDEMIDAFMQTLREKGQLERTYVVFTSDNGFHLGHRRHLAGKQGPYEEDVRVPFFVRGPGVRKGASRLVSGNVDLAPTFAEIGGADAPEFIDGRSLLPLFAGEASPASWRRGFLLAIGSENRLRSFARRGQLGPVDGIIPYRAVRTDREVYVEYANGEKELYDLQADPDQLENLAGTADAARLRRLATLLDSLAGCEAEACAR
jgi:N-acetylglucosamine-6-sulfatase